MCTNKEYYGLSVRKDDQFDLVQFSEYCFKEVCFDAHCSSVGAQTTSLYRKLITWGKHMTGITNLKFLSVHKLVWEICTLLACHKIKH